MTLRKRKFSSMVSFMRTQFLCVLLLTSLLIIGCTQSSEETHTPAAPTGEPQEFIDARQRLADHAILTQNLTDTDVIQALRTVPRHRFVTPEYVEKAYNDTALPIGYGQTISQPSLVAYMTELLALESGDKVLEIGTGSGYQAALLAELGYVDVYSIEIVPELYTRSTALLNELGYAAVQTRQGDGYYGWPEAAPFDAIIVTAAPDHLPAPLAEQLAEGGIMVIPIGPQGFYQTLWKFVMENNELTAYDMGGVVFVPFTGYIEKPTTPKP
ncbi:MAG: protein-L-isoaspartate(D-aspartate) O-methyltransferase [Chloroflexota bacterium]|nr:protein-L-isoaspartate(D-aspartate) O-methyltransferase [Chloroflexota bacterium]